MTRAVSGGFCSFNRPSVPLSRFRSTLGVLHAREPRIGPKPLSVRSLASPLAGGHDRALYAGGASRSRPGSSDVQGRLLFRVPLPRDAPAPSSSPHDLRRMGPPPRPRGDLGPFLSRAFAREHPGPDAFDRRSRIGPEPLAEPPTAAAVCGAPLLLTSSPHQAEARRASPSPSPSRMLPTRSRRAP